VKDKNSRTKLLRVLSGLTLLISIVLLVSTTLIPMDQGFSNTQTNKGIEVAQLASLIPPNESVYTGANELPIVSAQAWNTWIYGPERNYTLFNSIDGEPYNLSNNSLVAASGSYVLFSKNYEGPPRFNNFYVSGTLPSISAFQPYHSSTNVFLPSGNYTLSLNVNYTPSSIVKFSVNSGNSSLIPLPENYAIIQPFKVDSPTDIGSINVPGQMFPGYYVIQSMITKNMSTGSMISQDSVSRNEYNTPSLTFSYANTLLYPNTTYYFWLWSSGVPGGLYVPVTNNVTSGNSEMALIYNGTGYDGYGYYFSSYSNLSKNEYGLAFTLVGSSENSSVSRTYPTSLTIIFGGSVFNATLLAPRNFTYNIYTTTSHSSGFAILSPFLNGAIEGITFEIFSHTYVALNLGLGFNLLYLSFVFVFLVFGIIVLASLLRTPIKKSKRIHRISKYILWLSTMIFFTAFSIFYYLDYFVLNLLDVLSLLMLVSLILTLIHGEYLNGEDKSDSILLWG
jgi:hypothetical protein